MPTAMQAHQNKCSRARKLYLEALQIESSNVVVLRGLAELESRAGNHTTRVRIKAPFRLA